MSDLILTGGSAASITSTEIAELVGSRHDSVKRTIERLVEAGVIVQPPLVDEPGTDAMGRPRPVQVFRFSGEQGKRDSIIVVAQLSPEFTAKLVDRWQELESRASHPLSPAEALLQSVKMMVEQERRTKLVEQQQVQQAKALERLDAKVEQVAEQQVWTSRPQNAESITHLVPRLMRKYGLPERIIKEALRQLPYSPKPAGVVRNDNESARGSTYAVYWVADVNKVFDRFVRECHHETATQATHPFIDGRFKLVGDMVRA